MKNRSIDPLDARKYYLRFYYGSIVNHDVELKLTQRDLRIILKHIETRNKYIANKLKGFIQEVDERKQERTDWGSYTPKTSVIRLDNDIS